MGGCKIDNLPFSKKIKNNNNIKTQKKMKKFFYFLAAVIVAVTVTSCKSKEEKAAELIKQELSHVLCDFGSYEPIETVVTEAKHIPTNDSACVNKALDAIAYHELAVEYTEDSKSALETMCIWGSPSRYSTSYSDNRYYESKYEFIESLKKANICIKKYNSSIDDLKIMMKNTNPSETIGYNVEHTFRCKSKGGIWSITQYRFVVDKKIKKIIFCVDEKDEVSDFIESVQNGITERIDTLDLKKYTK